MQEIDFEVIDSTMLVLDEVNKYDKIIISPGPGLPEDFPAIFELLHRYHTSKQILGICLGHQAIAQYFGASLINISPVVHGQGHRLNVLKRNALLDGLPESFRIGLYHSWAVSEHKLPAKINITAKAENGIIMAIDIRDLPIYGIQFHPESHITEFGFEILSNFIFGI
jgi:anthranilate synthase/aminodeoxychorismate synthase-like glutamine amidotransferase